MSIQDYFRGFGGGSYHMEHDTTWLTFPDGSKLEVPYHHSNKLLILFETLVPSRINSIDFDDLSTALIHLNVADERNQNISLVNKNWFTNTVLRPMPTVLGYKN